MPKTQGILFTDREFPGKIKDIVIAAANGGNDVVFLLTSIVIIMVYTYFIVLSQQVFKCHKHIRSSQQRLDKGAHLRPAPKASRAGINNMIRSFHLNIFEWSKCSWWRKHRYE